MAPTSSKEKQWKGDVLNYLLITIFDHEVWYLVCRHCSQVSGKEVCVNRNHAFVPSHWVAHFQFKNHKIAVHRIEARRESKSESGTSTRKNKQRNIFGDGFIDGPPVCKGMKNVAKEKIITTAKPYTVPPKRYEFMFCSIVMYFSFVLDVQR